MTPTNKFRLLLHVCCAPCASYVYPELQKHNFDVTGYFYNPNIHPYQEFTQRFESLKLYASVTKMNIIYNENYDLEDHLRLTMSCDRTRRCVECYKLRLYATAAFARAKEFDYFSTSLLISPHQNHAAIIEAGMEMSRLHGVAFYYMDFRPGFRAAQSAAREMKLYRQKYCGCIFSEKERFARETENSYTSAE